MQEENSQKVKQ